MVNWFIRQAMENKTITIFGDGSQIRDYIFVEDPADAFITTTFNPACYGTAFNVGSGTGTSFRNMVGMVLDIVGSGQMESIPWPQTYINVETGDHITDIGKISRTTDWRPRMDLRTGSRMTYEYYQNNRSAYW